MHTARRGVGGIAVKVVRLKAPIRRGCVALAILACAGLPFEAFGQSATTTEPSTIKQRLEHHQQAPTEPSPEVQTPAAPAEVAPQPPEELRTVLGAVVIEGATVFTPQQLAATYKKYLARKIGFEQVQEIAAAITKMYRDAGYFLSRARVPPQLPKLGVLHVQVVEGYIDQVAFTGSLKQRDALYRAYGDKIAAGRPTKLATVERYVLLLGDLPGITAKGSVKEIDAEQGRYRLEVAIKRDTVAGYASVDNRGTRAVGRYQALLDVAVNGALDGRDQTGVTLFTIPGQPKELIYGEVRHSHTFGSEGLKVTARASHSESDAGENFSASNLGNRSTRGSLEVAYPAIRGRAANLWLNGAVEAISQRQDQFQTQNYDDELRIARAGIFTDLTDQLDGYNSLRLTYSQGFNIMGASGPNSQDVSRTDGQAAFNKVYAEVRRHQPFLGSWAIDLRAAGQWADDRLLSAEEFFLGGSRYGRAYDSGEISGSQGVAGSAELQWAQYANGLPWLDIYQLYGFYDAGAVWETSNTSYDGRASLASAGGGLRLTFPNKLYAGIEVAKPLTRNVEAIGPDAKGPRLFFYASGNF